MLDELFERFQKRDRRALSRLISLAARGEQLAGIRGALHKVPASSIAANSIVIAVTGSAGVGKSTLVAGLVSLLRKRDRTVAVFACDPESPLTGGALLGDRIRMPAADDGGVYIRSLSVPGGRQSIADNLNLMVELTKVFGFQVILVETVGAGQGDTAIRAIADIVLLLIQPESGDDLQWEKAGLLEIADLIVVQKADLAGADRLEAELRQQLNFPGARDVPIARTHAIRQQGIDQLWQICESMAATRGKSIG